MRSEHWATVPTATPNARERMDELTTDCLSICTAGADVTSNLPPPHPPARDKSNCLVVDEWLCLVGVFGVPWRGDATQQQRRSSVGFREGVVDGYWCDVMKEMCWFSCFVYGMRKFIRLLLVFSGSRVSRATTNIQSKQTDKANPGKSHETLAIRGEFSITTSVLLFLRRIILSGCATEQAIIMGWDGLVVVVVDLLVRQRESAEKT